MNGAIYQQIKEEQAIEMNIHLGFLSLYNQLSTSKEASLVVYQLFSIIFIFIKIKK
jgi:hypothetical protein